MTSKSYWVEPIRNRATGEIVSYKARYRLPDGSKPSRNFPVKGAPPGGALQQAKDWLAEVRRDRNYGVHVDQRAGRTVTFAQEATRWLESMAAGIEASTYRDYESILRVWLLPRFGTWPLADITYDDIQRYVNELGGWDARQGRFVPERAKTGAARIRLACHVLQAILAEAVVRGRLARSPYVKVRRPRSGTKPGRAPRKMRWLSPAQVDALADAVPERYRAAVYVMAWGGLRWGELAALRRDCCALLDTGQLRILEARKPGSGVRYGDTKSHQTRNVYLPPTVCKILTDHLERHVGPAPAALMFTAPEGGALHYKNFVERIWKPALERVVARSQWQLLVGAITLANPPVPIDRAGFAQQVCAPALAWSQVN